MSTFANKLKIAVCDDIPADRENVVRLLQKYLDENHYTARIDTFPSGEEFLAGDTRQYELMVLDIFMGELNGIQVAERLMDERPGLQIIFCSTSNAYAMESYDVGALRYLTKPVQEEKLFRTLDRYFHVHKELRMLTFKQNRMDEHIYISDILWIEAGDHKSVIHTKNGSIVTGTLFKSLCGQLEGMDFIKPIRYAMVSLQAVTAMPTDVLTLMNGMQIPISRNLRQQIKQAFTDYKMKTLLKKGGLR